MADNDWKDEGDGGEDSALLQAVRTLDRENPTTDKEEIKKRLEGTFEEADREEEEIQSTEDEDEVIENEDEDLNSESEDEDDNEEQQQEEEEDIEAPAQVSDAAKESFAKLRESKETWKNKATEYQQQLETLQSQLESVPSEEDLEKLKAERDEYKNIVESEFFQQDPAFVSEYKKPVDTAYQDVVKWAQAGLPTDEAKEDAAASFNKMASLMGDPANETEYLQAVDEVASLFERDSFKARFITSAEKWFDAGKNYKQAVGQKEETQKYLSQKRKERLEKEGKSVTGMLDSSFSDWERENQNVVEFYKKNNDKIKYDDLVKESTDKARKLFQNFYDTGSVTRELADFVVGGGVIGSVQQQSQGLMLELIKANSSLIEEKNKAIADLEEQLNDLGGTPRKAKSGNKYKDLGTKRDAYGLDPNQSALAQMVKKVRAGEKIG